MSVVTPIMRKTTKYSPPCRIVDNVVIGEEAPIYTERIGIGELLFEKLSDSPDFVGQVDSVSAKEMTFAEMKDRSVRCALWLKSRGIRAGDVVAVATHNHLDSIAPFLGCLYIGAHFYPIHDKMNIHDCRNYISLTRPKIIFVNAEMAAFMAQAAKEENLAVEIVTFGETDGFRSYRRIIEDHKTAAVGGFRCRPIVSLDEIGVLICSSGSTGSCKPIMLSHFTLINYMLRDRSFATKNETVVMWFSNLRWICGAMLPLQSIYFRKTRIVCPGYDEELACKSIERYNVEWMFLQPSLSVCILRSGYFHKYRMTSLKKYVLAGISMRPDMRRAIMKALPHTPVLMGYGMTEVGGIFTVQRQGDKISSVGHVFENTRLKVIDKNTGKLLGPNKIGELLLKTPYVMSGYYNNPQATKEILDKDGWIHSGDLGYYDENGEVYIYDRIKETIRVRGFFVYPSDIENLLEAHPTVKEVAVVRVKSDIYDECPIAFVSKIPGKEVTAEELMKLVENNLEEHMQLRGGVQFLDEIPHTHTGKIARNQLKEMAKCFVFDYVHV